jgi:alpha-1,2-mannosyltransferase
VSQRTDVPPVAADAARGVPGPDGAPARSGVAGRTAVTVARPTALAALAALAGWFVATHAVRHGFFDLDVYYGALRYWWYDHGQVYDYLRPHSPYGFTYPPFAALAMLPITLVPWHVAIAVSVVASALAALVVLAVLTAPLARRQGWPAWFTVGSAACLAAALEPVTETVSFGQVNLVLVALVVVDLLVLEPRGHAAAGVGVGLATAVKLTPGVFVLYLLLTRRWRTALVGAGTAVAATVLAAAISPDTARIYFTDALFNSGRIGVLAFVSNQSLQGFVARLDPRRPSLGLWLALVATVVAVWCVRVRRAARAGDRAVGLALTAVLGCLLSPVSWVHHLVWLLPALVLLVDRGLAGRGVRRVGPLALCAAAYLVLCGRVVWRYEHGAAGWQLLGANAYLVVAVLLLLCLPVRAAPDGLPAQRAGGTVRA